MTYKVYSGFESNPAQHANNYCCEFDDADTAYNYAEGLSSPYVEVVGPFGIVPHHPEHKGFNFLLFAGDNYYPSGGYADFKAGASTEDELRDIIRDNERKSRYSNNRFDWWQIVNANTHTIVAEGYCG